MVVVAVWYLFVVDLLFKPKTADEVRIRYWSSDVCSSDLVLRQHHQCRRRAAARVGLAGGFRRRRGAGRDAAETGKIAEPVRRDRPDAHAAPQHHGRRLSDQDQGPHPAVRNPARAAGARGSRSEEHTSDLQSLMRSSYAVFCLKKKPPI